MIFGFNQWHNHSESRPTVKVKFTCNISMWIWYKILFLQEFHTYFFYMKMNSHEILMKIPHEFHMKWISREFSCGYFACVIWSSLTSASLQLLMKRSIWFRREFSSTSLCSSCPFRQVSIKHRKGWWLRRDLLQGKKVIFWREQTVQRILSLLF